MTKPQQVAARLDAGLERDLRVLSHTKLSNSALVKEAMKLLANVCHVAWTEGVVKPGELPELMAYKYRLPPEHRPPVEGVLSLPLPTLPKE
ncbi:hypothetical protein [Streptomyces sp. NPDC056796]|uniref:hypothetical protein n=1 Tax=Streptomyces sp. NPDC056796 TaxID=3345947 RepID=UPI00367CEFCC